MVCRVTIVIHVMLCLVVVYLLYVPLFLARPALDDLDCELRLWSVQRIVANTQHAG